MKTETKQLLIIKLLLKKVSSCYGLILAAFILFSYFDGLHGDFVFDDVSLIKEDPFYRSESNPLACWSRSFWKQGGKGLYRPLTLFSYWLNTKICGLYSPSFRIGSLFLHLLVTLLVYRSAVRLRFGKLCAIFAALLFAVHPVHTEAVIPAFGRGELLCALFLLTALILHSYTGGGRKFVLGAGLCFLFSCWSKEHGIIFLPLCFLQDFYLKGAFWKNRYFLLSCFRAYFFYLFVFGLFVWTRYCVLGTVIPAKENFDPAIDNRLALCPILLREVGAVRVQGLALLKLFFPKTLSHDYSYAQIPVPESIWDFGAWGTLIVFGGILISAYFCLFSKRKKILFLIGAYLISLIPAGNFVVSAGTIFAERLQYIPSIWFCLAFFLFLFQIRARIALALGEVLACGARLWRSLARRKVSQGGKSRSPRRSLRRSPCGVSPRAESLGLRRRCRAVGTQIPLSRKILPVFLFAVFVIIAGSVRTYMRCRDWDSDMSLAVAGVKTSPLSVKTWNNLAVQLEKVEDYKGAITACDKALSIYPAYVTAFANRGGYHARLGNYKEAECDLRKAVSLHANHIQANFNLGALMANLGRLDDAKEIWERSLRNNPDQPELKDALKKLYIQMREKNPAKDYMELTVP